MNQLPEWLAYTQIGANIFLGATAALIAFFSLRWSYRHNFGWEPGIRVAPRHYGWPKEHPDHAFSEATIEIWNRHKYPICVKLCECFFDGVTLDESKAATIVPRPDKYLDLKNPVRFYVEDKPLQPLEIHRYTVRVFFLRTASVSPRASIHIKVRYYDPRKNMPLMVEHRDKLLTHHQESLSKPLV